MYVIYEIYDDHFFDFMEQIHKFGAINCFAWLSDQSRENAPLDRIKNISVSSKKKLVLLVNKYI